MESKAIATFEEYITDQFGNIPEDPNDMIELGQDYAVLYAEQANKEWENEIKELKQEIYFLNNSSNFQ